MLKHVGHHRSTSSMTRPSSSSLKIRSDPPPPKIIRTQDDSDVPYETNVDRESLYSSPEFLRRHLSSPESCTSDQGDHGSPEVTKRNSGRSKSLQSSPVISKKLLDVPEDSESITFSHDLLDVPDHFPSLSSNHESDEDSHSSPEMSKKDILSRPSTLPRRGVQRALDVLAGRGQVLRQSFRSADTCSLSSNCSFSSLGTCKLSSRASSTSSLAEQAVIPVKVYLRFMRPDIEYKTMRLSTATTCRQLINLLLAKFRLRHRDPNLFFVRMEITVRSPGVGAPTRRLLVLDDQARPAELQQCRPRGDARFSVGVRRGGLLRVHDSILMPGSQYKSLLVSYRTTAEELVQLMLNCYNRNESPRHYAVHEVNKCPYSDRPLRPDEYPLLVQSEWPRPDRQNYSFVLRRNVNYALSLKARILWRRSLDQSSTDTESEHEDHLAPSRKARAPSLPVSHTPLKNCGSLLPESLNGPSSKSLLVSSCSLSPSISRVSCDSGFSSPSSSSRSSTASAGSPSPPASPSPSTNSGSNLSSKPDLQACKSTVSVINSPTPKSLPTSSCSVSHSKITLTVSQSEEFSSESSIKSNNCSNSSTPIHATVVSTQDTSSERTNVSAPSILTIPLSPIPVPSSPPSLSVLSSSVAITTLSPVASTPIAIDSCNTRSSSSTFLSSSYVSYIDSDYTTFISSSEPPSSLDIQIGGTMIPPSSAPLSPSSPTLSRKCIVPPSPSAPTSPTKDPPSLQSTIITIPTSGPSVVSSNTLSQTSAGMKELSAALESLRTLTIRCPNYDSCFYI